MPSPIFTKAEMRRWEAVTWRGGQTEAAVIDLVGQAIATRLLQGTTPSSRILVLVGKGNNGADARAAAGHLDPFREVIQLDFAEPTRILGPLKRALAGLRPEQDWIVDGLFGIGLSRPLDRAWRRVIETVNQSGVPALAVDVPSGLDGDTGEPQGAAIRATVTLTVGAPKIGLLQTSAAPWVGRLEVANKVGLSKNLPRAKSRMEWVLPDDFTHFPPARPVSAHKGTFGHVVVVAGSMGYHGAAVLATKGALRARPGLVTVTTDPSVYLPVASQLQAAMVHPWNEQWALPKSASALVIGPGLAAKSIAPGLKEQIIRWWKTIDIPVLADASALDWLNRGGGPRGALRVITPHPGEAARLLGVTTAAVQADRPGAFAALSRRFGGCHVVLKGHQTLTGKPGGRILVNNSGNPGLAQGGSGDLLAGYLGGLLAQPAWQQDLRDALAFGVWRHGAAADQLAAQGKAWTVEDLSGVI